MVVADRERPAEDQVLGKVLGFEIGLGVNFFVHARHGNEHGGANFEEGLRELVDEWAVGQRHAIEEQGEIHVARCDMRQGQK